jgi:uncharacterized protein YecE (DUF72 family)
MSARVLVRENCSPGNACILQEGKEKGREKGAKEREGQKCAILRQYFPTKERVVLSSVVIGTSSWLFDGWRGVFYPDKLPKSDYLPFYATAFQTVEVNTSFYALPPPSTLINWVESVPAGFTFALKFPRAISHDKKLTNVTEETLAFLDALRALGPAAGPAFLQLPPTFTRKSYGKPLALYLDWLALQGPDLRLAVEVRAADLMTPAFAAYLAERGLALALVDRQGAPDLFDVWLELAGTAQAPPFAFIRWIGDDRNGPQGDREIQAPRDEALARWAQRIGVLADRGLDVFGYVHNPYEGHSPATVRRLQVRLAEYLPLPPWPPEGYAGAGQMSLL